MLILLYGPSKCGKKEVVKYLVEQKSFKKLDFSLVLYDFLVKLGQWNTNYVAILPNITDWQVYKKRPCARLVVLFAPSKSNWRNENDDKFLSKILCYDDAYKVTNFGTLDDLTSKVEKCLVAIRPSWDVYFMNIAIAVSLRSNCMKSRVGCVLVKENRIISTGYNGTAINMPNCYENGCKRCNAGVNCTLGLDYCLCLHAEENSLLFLGKERSKGCSLYVTRFPCQLCCRKIVQMELKEVIFLATYGVTDEGVYNLFKGADILVRQLQI